MDAGPTPATGIALLSFDDLQHYAWLPAAVWVLDTERRRICWANPAALDFWRAASLPALTTRDLGDAWPDALLRLPAAMQRHAGGQVLRESWTLTPIGQALTTVLVSRGKPSST